MVPKALGNCLVLGEPCRADIKEILNLKVKRCESVRPFAPSSLEERTEDWFTIDYPDRFTIEVYPIRPERRATIPAVTQVDGAGQL